MALSDEQIVLTARQIGGLFDDLAVHDGSEMPLADYDKMPTAWKLLRPCSRRRKHKGSME